MRSVVTRGIAWQPSRRELWNTTQKERRSEDEAKKSESDLSSCSTSFGKTTVSWLFLYLNHSIVSCDGQCNSFDSVLGRCLCGAHADSNSHDYESFSCVLLNTSQSLILFDPGYLLTMALPWLWLCFWTHLGIFETSCLPRMQKLPVRYFDTHQHRDIVIHLYQPNVCYSPGNWGQSL